jgi:hypothetical protein
MNRLFLKTSIFVFLMGILSCAKESTLDITQAEQTQHFDVAGGVKYVTVKSNKDFTATSNALWCVPEIYPGGREYNLGIIVERNELADARNATVTVAAEGMTELLISVSQTGAGPIITVSSTTVMVDEDNPEFTLEITANLPFIYELPDWIQPKADNVPSIGTRLYDFTVSPLPDGETEREGTLIVKAADATVNKSVTVKQTKAIDPFEGVKGRWLFEDADDIGKAVTGNDLAIFESTTFTNGTLHTGGPMSLVAGPKATDQAVRVPMYSYFKCEHGIVANGGGNRVNEYTMMFDFKVPALSKYYTFFNTSINGGIDDNSSNADFFIRGNGTDAIGGGVFSYSTATPIEANEWYRLVISVRVGETVKYYLNGELHFTSTNVSTVDNVRASLRTDAVLFFNDDSSEDNELDVAEIAIWGEALDAARVQLLGTAGD